MRRRGIEVNTRDDFAKLFFVAVFAIVLVVGASSCGGADRRAERLWRQAIEHVDKGDTQGAVDRLQKIIDEYPDARVAEKAREQIIVYKGLATAVQDYPVRRARELMVLIARASESFRHENGRAPATLDELVPAKMANVPKDPWGHPFLYASTARGYRLTCQGADGAPGGAGDATDLIVVDGAFLPAQP
jgi:type II secretion system (T2SS) protein G